MGVYYMVILCLFGLSFIGAIKVNNGIRKKLSAGAMISILALVAGLRYRVGTDYTAYFAGYYSYKKASMQLLKEPGIKILARISAMILDRPETMIFLASVITVVLMTVTIVRNSDIYWLSILLYVFLGVWHGSFNGVRQYLAASILFAGHCFIRKKNFWKWCIVVAIACMFHITAVIAVLFYFWGNQKISGKQVWISGLVILIGSTAYDRIFAMIGFLKGDELDTSLSYITNSINPFRILVAWVPVVFFVVFRQCFDSNDEKVAFYFNMSLLNAILMTVAMNSTYLGRVGIYTGVYNTITWPILLKPCNKQSKQILVFFMLILYFLYWRTEATGVWLSNFRWVFQK